MRNLAAMRVLTFSSRGAHRRRPIITLGLVLLIVAITFAMSVLSLDERQHVANTFGITGARWDWLSPLSYLTLITYAFLHGSTLHYFGNTLMLLLVGVVVEARVGRWTMLGIWITGSALAGLAHLALLPSLGIPLIGASGGVAALLGVALVACRDVRLPVRIGRLAFVIPLWAPLSLWAAMQVFMFVVRGLLAETPAVTAYWSHVAGFAFGVIAIAALRVAPRANSASLPVRESVTIGD
jgi:membrane associated rhomboid family serine protease